MRITFIFNVCPEGATYMKCYFCGGDVDEKEAEVTKSKMGHPICVTCLVKMLEIQSYTRGVEAAKKIGVV